MTEHREILVISQGIEWEISNGKENNYYNNLQNFFSIFRSERDGVRLMNPHIQVKELELVDQYRSICSGRSDTRSISSGKSDTRYNGLANKPS